MEMQSKPNLLKEGEVAARLNVSIKALRAWRLQRRGPKYCKVEGCVRYRPEDIEEWLDEKTVEVRK